LYSYALHVLAATSIDVALLVHMSAEWRIGPFILVQLFG